MNLLRLAQKTTSFVVGCGLVLSFAAGSANAQTSIDLTQNPTVRAAGSYTYYARGDANAVAVTPFTKMFYPGGTLHSNVTNNYDSGLVDTGSNGAPISFTSGSLTNGNNTQKVNGWVNIEQLVSGPANSAHVGSFDIVLNLGAVYTITSVVVTYTDQATARWTTANPQAIFTSVTAPATDAALSAFGAGTVSGNVANALMTVSGTAIDAQYVVFRPNMGLNANPSSGSNGGMISEITIYGYSAIPEPSAWAALAGGAGLFAAVGCRRRRA